MTTTKRETVPGQNANDRELRVPERAQATCCSSPARPGVSNERSSTSSLERVEWPGKPNHLDLAKLIRSLQRAEGNVDCFQRMTVCDQLECAWRSYCLSQVEVSQGLK